MKGSSFAGGSEVGNWVYEKFEINALVIANILISLNADSQALKMINRPQIYPSNSLFVIKNISGARF